MRFGFCAGFTKSQPTQRVKGRLLPVVQYRVEYLTFNQTERLCDITVGFCNFNLRTLGILNLLGLGLGGLCALGAGIGIRNLGIGQGSDSLQGALGAGIGIWNLGISSLQGALGAGIGI